MTRARSWIDVSVPIHNGMPEWPGDHPLVVDTLSDVDAGDEYSLAAARLTWHIGTHMDAPGHFVKGGERVDRFPVELGIGPARVVGIRHPKLVTARELRTQHIRRGERILFRTRNSRRCWQVPSFTPDFVALAEDAAEWLADRQVAMVGIDYLSIDPFESETMAAHRILLGSGIWVVEGLYLGAVVPGRYDMVCVPLRIVGGDGSPCRALLRPRR